MSPLKIDSSAAHSCLALLSNKIFCASQLLLTVYAVSVSVSVYELGKQRLSLLIS